MATSLLFIGVTVFAIRGFFLGFVGVIGKVLGLIFGYIVALSFRADVAAWVSVNTTINLPSLVIEVGCGAALFFATLFTVGFIVLIFAGALKKIIPPLKPILDDNSTAGRVTGAISNGLLGALIVLIGIWGYGLLGKGDIQSARLQQIANIVGNTLFNTVKDNSHFSFTSSKNSTTNERASTPSKTYNTTKSSAIIVSESDPNKILSIESTDQEIIKTKQTIQNNDLMQLLSNDKIQELLKNPQIQQLAMQQLKNNPQQLSELSEQNEISPELLQELLNKLPSLQQSLQQQ